ncbi:MAG: hypothetical protein KF799_13815 [Bdellovibrionales bacterium]|nr:hypothetical protein [Bdellovibrionales bacterium]
MSPQVLLALKSIVLPAALATVALFLVGGLKDPLRSRLQALILALGYVLGAYLLLNRFEFPPILPADSMYLAALLLALFVVIAPKDVRSRYGIRAVFVLLTGGVLLWHLRATLNTTPNMRNMLAFFCLGLGVWSILERSARQVSLPSLIAVPMVACAATAALLMFTGSSSFSQMAGVLCGQLGAALVVAGVKPARMSSTAVLPFLSIFVILFMLIGHFYQDVNPWWFIYLCWPFAVLWIRTWLPLPKNPYAEAIVLVILSALPVGYFLSTVVKQTGLPV